MFDRRKSPSFSHPSESNRKINFVFDGVNTYLDPSLPTSPQQLRTSLPTDLSVAIKNQSQSYVSSISSIMSGTTNTGTGRGYLVQDTARMESEVLAKQVAVPKDKRGTHGSRERGIH